MFNYDFVRMALALTLWEHSWCPDTTVDELDQEAVDSILQDANALLKAVGFVDHEAIEEDSLFSFLCGADWEEQLQEWKQEQKGI